ncbi:bifunctional diaminohydroxyphosphoribosylaminopyrimidine deaminase/5-amino-6-(5-phosphoribosylamino)uracil reductase RibD [Falsarthrobacter nasiphocae]|uniref:Riboflavin biosynthesis protein RibD n=1 Tax=Falsarthrobacter nasiphocae TaxID=189863 RepID=A0AAE3YFG0_9MICC|nr:bifunctional diaminohydroxyphosphoribosylaminopyrimidine deaminase/5-amino-6-(5-phosphoribosylamino)uracil reductase RibD [Falsarthrobacter nasiphocae]MDR6891237.1 diaminohydroxyphosphoribosylaminopyrimidine deaminase/5-amino-6-(5-phosphoribosylamino)uracil reductase [Falsarthrobacter nasiphocae]
MTPTTTAARGEHGSSGPAQNGASPDAAALEPVMRRALELAQRTPAGANPRVGAVVLSDDGAVLGEGWHRGAGTPHAEPAALEDARSRGHDVRGGTIVITLEPCSHTGRTPPCTEAILEAGLRRVVFAAPDATAEARGGADRLAEAGLTVQAGLLREDSEALNERWAQRMAEGRPFVTAKVATSLDFCVADAEGRSQWITSEQARAHAQGLRRRVDAILVGTGTLAADNPRLTARTPRGEDAERQPLRVVVGLGEVPADAAVRGTDGRFVHVRSREPEAVLRELARLGAGHVMIEGGPRLVGAFLEAGLVDELWHYQAPLLLPGGLPAASGLAPRALGDAARFRVEGTELLGPDLLIRRMAVSGEAVTTGAAGNELGRAALYGAEKNH